MRTRNRRGSKRSALRREAACIVAVLTDRDDFAAMRAYPTFEFDDYDSYLDHVAHLLRAVASAGTHVRVTLFDPAEFEQYCFEESLPPDAAASRASYAAAAGPRGPAVDYRGERLGDLIESLRHQAGQLAMRDTADAVLGDYDPSGAAADRAADLLVDLVDGLGCGVHHLVASMMAGGALLSARLHVECAGELVRISAEDARVFSAVLSAALAAPGGTGGVVARSCPNGGRQVLRGWRVAGGSLRPLTEAEVFNAYCTDPGTGDPVPPEPDVRYAAGFPLRPGEY